MDKIVIYDDGGRCNLHSKEVVSASFVAYKNKGTSKYVIIKNRHGENGLYVSKTQLLKEISKNILT